MKRYLGLWCAVMALLGMCLFVFDQSFMWLLRAGTVSLWLIVTLYSQRSSLVSPSWILSTVIIFFYMMFPLCIEYIFNASHIDSIVLVKDIEKFTVPLYRLIDTKAELYVLIILLMFNAEIIIKDFFVNLISIDRPYIGMYSIFIPTLICFIIIYTARLSQSPYTSIIHDLSIPIIVLGFCYALIGALQKGSIFSLEVVLSAAIMCASLAQFDAKYVFFLMLGLLPIVIWKVGNVRNICVCTALIVTVLSLVIYSHLRNDQMIVEVKELPMTAQVEEKLFGKLFTRQYYTLICLNGALASELAANQSFSDSVFFAAALVPRALWPNKPSLSRGEEYTLYCGKEAIIPGHFSSITMLGEPAIHGGTAMIVLAMGIIVLTTGSVGVLIARAPLPFAAMGMALNPWLLDFDMHFSLWLALVVRGILIMLPFALFLYWREKRLIA